MRKFLPVFFAVFAATPAFAIDCPPSAPSCKVVTMTPEEVNAIDAIFSAAVYANRMQMQPLTDAWKNKIGTSPDGTVPKAPETKPPGSK